MGTPPPPPPLSRADFTAYTRKTRAFEPDDPQIAAKRIDRARLTELERIPAEVRDIHRALLNLLPEQVFAPDAGKNIRAILHKYTQLDVDLWLDSVRVLARTQLRSLVPGATFIAVIGLEPLTEKILVELDLRVVYQVVDRLLGGRGAVDVHRPLTDIEHGVFSFLLLKVLHLFQQEMEQADQIAARLEDMRNDLRSCADILRRQDHWMVMSWKMNVDLDVGFARAFLPVSLARRLGSPPAPDDSYLTARRHGRIRQRLGRLGGATFIGHVEAGRIDLPPEDARALDPGDIVVLEESGLGLDEDGCPAGTATLRFGNGHRALIHGVAGPVEGQRVFQIERVETFVVPNAHDPQLAHGTEESPERVMAEYEHHPEQPEEGYEEADDGSVRRLDALDEDWGLDAEHAAGGGDGYDDYGEGYEEAPAEGYDEQGYDEQGYAQAGEGEGYEEQGYEEVGYEEAGDNLPEMEPLLAEMAVPVIVELGRVELTAEEVICLRPGQLLELGRSPTDPVDLVVNGRLLAKGELVEIEGQLGIRIQSLVQEPS